MFRKRLKWKDFVDKAEIRFLIIPLIVFHQFRLTVVNGTCPPCNNDSMVPGYGECPSLVTVNSSLLIKHLDEGIEHKEILNTNYGNCDLDIVNSDPTDITYVQINKTSNMLTSIALDREHPAFSKMLIPQIQVHLRLDCAGGIPNAFANYDEPIDDIVLKHGDWRDFPTTFNDRSYVLTGDIDFQPGKIMLTIIIEDINDNKPVFKYPPSTNYLIGYPSPMISEDIFLDYLIKVVATDSDVGLNATIRYSLDPNDDFRINPETGEIFPTSNAMQYKDKLTLKIIAKDRNGAKDGLQSTIDIIVNKVSPEHIVLVTVEGETPTKIYKVIKDLQKSSGIDFRFLRKGFVSGNQPKMTNLFIDRKESVTLKGWIYGFDDNKELFENTKLIEKFSQKPNGVSIIPYKGIKKTIGSDVNPKKEDDGYFIIIVVTVGLSSAIGVIIIVGIIHWILHRRNRYKRMSTPSETGTTISTISNDVDSNNHHHHHHHLYQKRESFSRKKNSILKARSSLPESTEDLERFARKMNHILGDISEGSAFTPNMDIVRPPEKRKSSVTFSDEVKCINIGEDNKVEETITVKL